MDYRIYVDGTGGYYNLGTYNKDETLICLDWLILEEQTKQKILAIRIILTMKIRKLELQNVIERNYRR